MLHRRTARLFVALLALIFASPAAWHRRRATIRARTVGKTSQRKAGTQEGYKDWLDKDVAYIITRTNARLSRSSQPTTSANDSLKSSGAGAIPIPTPMKTSFARSTTSASPMPTSITLQAFPVGKPIVAASTSPGVNRTSRIAPFGRHLQPREL